MKKEREEYSMLHAVVFPSLQYSQRGYSPRKKPQARSLACSKLKIWQDANCLPFGPWPNLLLTEPVPSTSSYA